MQQISLLTKEVLPPEQLTSSLKLRDYQKHVIQEIYGWYRAGKKSVLLVSPTGSGKTVTAVHIMRDAVSRNCRVLFIIHCEPLVDLTVNTLVFFRQLGKVR